MRVDSYSMKVEVPRLIHFVLRLIVSAIIRRSHIYIYKF
jgi:hypothetical protein